MARSSRSRSVKRSGQGAAAAVKAAAARDPAVRNQQGSNSKAPGAGHHEAATPWLLRQLRRPGLVLVVLYVLQGLPLGFHAYMTSELSHRGAGLSDMALWAHSAWPFSLKLLWAPIVDAQPLFGRSVSLRKSYILGTQLGIATMCVFLSQWVDELLAARAILPMTAIFFVFYALCATQDVAVDGWALTLLSGQDVSLASTYNVVGQLTGVVIGRQLPALCPLSTFCLGLGLAFAVMTAAVVVFVPEKPPQPHVTDAIAQDRAAGTDLHLETHQFDHDATHHVKGDDEQIESVGEAYRHMFAVVRNRQVQVLFFFLLVYRLPFMIVDCGAIDNWLQRNGVSRSVVAQRDAILSPVSLVVPVLIALLGSNSLRLVSFTYAVRALAALMLLPLMSELIRRQPEGFQSGQDVDDRGFFLVHLAGASAVSAALSSMVFAALMGFFNTVADPRFGGTYMTLLNGCANIGVQWAGPVTLSGIAAVTRWTGADEVDVLRIGLLGSAVAAVLVSLPISKLIGWLLSFPRKSWLVDARLAKESPIDVCLRRKKKKL